MGRKALMGAALAMLLSLTLAPGWLFCQESVTEMDREKEAAALTAASKQYVLLKQGQWEVENDVSYAYYSTNQIYLQSFAILDPVFLTLGEFGVQSAKRSIFTYNLAGRYGITNNLQAEVDVPFVYRHDLLTVVGASAPEQTLNRGDLGDVSAMVSYQPLSETDKWPGVVVSLAYKSTTGKTPFSGNATTNLPTGTGYQSVKGCVNVIKSIDPVVVFGAFGYAYNLPVGGINQTVTAADGTTGLLRSVNPGDTMTLNLGLAYALSYKFSMNFQFQEDYTFSSKTNGKMAANTTLNSALFKVGTGWSITPRTSLNVNLATGLTSDSPDFVLEVRVPILF